MAWWLAAGFLGIRSERRSGILHDAKVSEGSERWDPGIQSKGSEEPKRGDPWVTPVAWPSHSPLTEMDDVFERNDRNCFVVSSEDSVNRSLLVFRAIGASALQAKWVALVRSALSTKCMELEPKTQL